MHYRSAGKSDKDSLKYSVSLCRVRPIVYRRQKHKEHEATKASKAKSKQLKEYDKTIPSWVNLSEVTIQILLKFYADLEGYRNLEDIVNQRGWY